VTRTRIHVAVGFSLLVHGLIAAIPIHKPPGESGKLAESVPFIARIVDAPVEVTRPRETPPPTAPLPVVRPRPAPPKVAAAAPPPAEPQAPPAEPITRPAPQFDMLAMINARRERRQAYEEAMVRQQREAQAAGPPVDPSLASLNRNLQTLNASREGVGGVFTILSKGTRAGEFAFNGWNPENRRNWREVIEVDAGPGGDVELAMVRRMIELIRSHYSGDFVWRSHRLGRTFVLSARPEDGAGLEEFLTREFFGTPTLAHQRHQR
jgi:hypothetical protein